MSLRKSRKVTLSRDPRHGGVSADYAKAYESPYGDYIAGATFTVPRAIEKFGEEAVRAVLNGARIEATDTESYRVEIQQEDGTWKAIETLKELRQEYHLLGPAIRVDGVEVEGRIGEAHWALAYLIG